MRFSKWQGLGNDFVMLDCRQQLLNNPAAWSIKLCDRHFGIGADGLALVESSDVADVRMRLINNDGSEAEMCGNLIRCVARYAYEHGIVNRTSLTVETLAGIMRPEIILEDGKVAKVKVDMGCPRLKKGEIPVLGEPDAPARSIAIALPDGQTFVGTAVSTGNPHMVIFVDNIAAVDLSVIGPQIEKHELFPKKINVEFAQVLAPDTVRMRVWERGAGITLACGTGSCATVVAGILTGRLSRAATVKLDGGDLRVEWPSDDSSMFMTGPATEVFRGEWIND